MHTNTTDRRAAISRAACAVVRLARLPELSEPANSHNAIVNNTRLYNDAEAWDSVVALEYMVSSHQLEDTPAVITSRDLWISHARDCGITDPTGEPLAELAAAYVRTHAARVTAGREERRARNAEELRTAAAESNRFRAALAWIESALEGQGAYVDSYRDEGDFRIYSADRRILARF